MTPDQGVTSGSQSHPANFNHSNLAGACATAREALLQLGSKHLNIPVDDLIAVDGDDSLKKRCLEESHLRRTRGRKEIRSQSGSRREAQARQRVDRARKTHRAAGHAADGHGHIRVCAQRARARHAAWHGGPPGGRGREPHECGRKLGFRNAGLRESGGQKEFCRRGRGKTLASRADCQGVESHLVARARAAEAGNFLRSFAESEADARHACS